MRLNVEVVARGLEVPWGLAWLPNGDLLVTERVGRLRLIRNGQLASKVVINVEDVYDVPPWDALFELGNEGGLLGVLAHPDYESNRLIYLYYTAERSPGQLINRLAQYKMSADGTTAQFHSMLLDDIPGGAHHQGGRMQIGPDGKLYVGVGAYDPPLAQNPNELPGKLLRMNLDGSIPADNPTRGSYVYLSGIRNTQGYDWFDDEHLLVMDHGPTAIDPGIPEKGWDEFNVVRAGDNLGWPEVMGCDARVGVTEPVLVWERSTPPAGAVFYRSEKVPALAALRGSFLFATLGLAHTDEGKHLHRIYVDPRNPYLVQKHEVYLKNDYGRLRTVATGPDGYIYITTSNCESRGGLGACDLLAKDRILRIKAAR